MVDLAKFVEGIPPTKSVYAEDSYLQTMSAGALRVVEEKSSVYLALDQTVFHPRSGGQPSDRGTVRGSSFSVDVKRAMLVGDVIVHYGRAEGKPSQGPVSCEIDWSYRFLMMRRHTAAHLLDHCLATVRGAHVETTDSWLGEDPYVGYVGATPSDLDLGQLQELANALIRHGANVEVRTLDRIDAERLIANAPNVSRLPKVKKLRMVTIQGQIAIPCGGTHVRNLSEIGGLKVGRTEPVETGFRLHFDVT